MLNLRSPVFCTNTILTDKREFVACFSGNHINVNSAYIANVIECDKCRIIQLRNGEKFTVSNTCDEIKAMLGQSQPQGIKALISKAFGK